MRESWGKQSFRVRDAINLWCYILAKRPSLETPGEQNVENGEIEK